MIYNSNNLDNPQNSNETQEQHEVNRVFYTKIGLHSDISEYNADSSYNSTQNRLFTYRQLDDNDNHNDIQHPDIDCNNNNRISPNRVHSNAFDHTNNDNIFNN